VNGRNPSARLCAPCLAGQHERCEAEEAIALVEAGIAGPELLDTLTTTAACACPCDPLTRAAHPPDAP
jgi:hypothetical protein